MAQFGQLEMIKKQHNGHSDTAILTGIILCHSNTSLATRLGTTLLLIFRCFRTQKTMHRNFGTVAQLTPAYSGNLINYSISNKKQIVHYARKSQ